MLNSALILEGTEHEHPDQIAVISGKRQMTYRELNEAANRLANALITAGIGAKDIVLLACPNILEFPICWFGIMKTGAVVAPVNILCKRRELEYFLEDTEAKAFICYEGSHHLKLSEEGIAAFDNVDSCAHFWMIASDPEKPSTHADIPTIWDRMAEQPVTFQRAFKQGDDCAEILYTAGTTGKSRGAQLTHQNLVTAAMTSVRLANATQNDRYLIVLPLFHCYAQTCQMNAGFSVGATIILMDRFSPSSVMKLMEKESVTLFAGVPAIYKALIKYVNPKKFDLEKISQNLRLACCGGAPMPVEVCHRIKELYNWNIREGYGLSETSAMATFNMLQDENQPGAVGRTVWGVQLKIVDNDMNDLPVGEPGEVVIRGHTTMKGYLHRTKKTEEAFRGGWFHTGDVGRLDQDGFLYLIDRSKDMIIRGGFNVWPREIEKVLMNHPGISQAAVVGVPDEQYGQEVKAYVTLENRVKISSQEIIAWSKIELAGYKYPRIVKVVSEMPLNPFGKIQKDILQEIQSEKNEGFWEDVKTREHQFFKRAYKNVVHFWRNIHQDS